MALTKIDDRGLKTPIDLLDNERIRFGTGNDLQIWHDGSNSYVRNYTGDLIIQQETDDGDIAFKSDDGSGGTTTYFRVDGSEVNTRFIKDLKLSTENTRS